MVDGFNTGGCNVHQDGFFRQCWRLIRPYWVSGEKWGARGLLAVIVALNLGEVYLNVLFNQWNNDFYNSLQAVDKNAFKQALIRFSYLAAIFIVVGVYKTYLNQMLRINWRRWMTREYIADWMNRQNFYRMQFFGEKTDNPDQRISEDIEQFIQLTLGLTLGLLSAVVTLFSFLMILWKLSGALDFDVYGMNISIPGYMVWVAMVYAAIGTWFTMMIGRPLVKLNFEQQRFEADFRFSLVRLRENSESIAFYKGEAQEQANFQWRFLAVVANFWQIMKRQKLLNLFTFGYSQIAIIFPYVVAAPRFFAGKIQLGGLMQTASAFGQVQSALSFIIESYNSIATWRAVTERLSGFRRNIHIAEESHLAAGNFERRMVEGNTLVAAGLALKLPDGKALLPPVDLAVKPGDCLLISGPSGAGKSTLLRALAGLWPYAEGRVEVPQGAQLLFVPQKSYLPLGSLRDVMMYPGIKAVSEGRLLEVMALCGLGALAGELDRVDHWSQMLSVGEQQRIAFARIMLIQPDFVFMDEASSALDEASEAYLYGMLVEHLPNMAMLSVGHRSGLKRWHPVEKILGSA
jgi:putative ATP-binding cassette transporter